MKFIQIEIVDPHPMYEDYHVVERTFYSSREELKNDFPQIEDNFLNGYHHDTDKVEIVMTNEEVGIVKFTKDGKPVRSFDIIVQEVETKK